MGLVAVPGPDVDGDVEGALTRPPRRDRQLRPAPMNATDRLLQRWRVRRALKWVPDGASVLDVGCADGALFDLGRARIRSGVGIEPDPSVREWRGHGSTRR